MKKFLKRWRFLNSHNETEPVNTFPIEKVKVGKYTYGGLKILSWGSEEEGLEIGNYCSIAAGVSFLLGGNHKTDGLLTFPSKVKIFKVAQEEAITKGCIIIEDDVWIGSDVVVLSGVTIGKGSVIGARSVISRNIEPYSIVTGNPGKVIKKRFNDEIIAYLVGVDFSKFDFSSFSLNEVEELYNKLNTVEDAKILISKLTKSK